MGIAQTRYSVKFCTLYKIIQLKQLWNSARDYKICKQKKIQGLLSTLSQKVLFFKDYKAFEKALVKFKHFQALPRTCTNPVHIILMIKTDYKLT